jgi:hypothetical protein
MNVKKRNTRIGSAVATLMVAVMAGCSSIDCSINNKVRTNYRLAGDVDTLKDTLTVSTQRIDGNDTVIYNKVVNIDSLLIPMSYNRNEDVFFFDIKRADGTSAIDTVTVTKTYKPHFESVDCAPAFFHDIQGVSTTHNAIDSIRIKKADVTYNHTKPHFYIYFKAHE